MVAERCVERIESRHRAQLERDADAREHLDDARGRAPHRGVLEHERAETEPDAVAVAGKAGVVQQLLGVSRVVAAEAFDLRRIPA